MLYQKSGKALSYFRKSKRTNTVATRVTDQSSEKRRKRKKQVIIWASKYYYR
ncbi:MAG: hypothetical protein PHE02_13430 [Lachnospiraceae bacterium]|nr:hypothetical protein [Lachnospiraceae bacterium]